MLEPLQLVAGILLVGAAIWAGDAISRGIDGALGETPIRTRARSRSRGE